MTAVLHNKIKLREVNRHLVCRLCRGYYVDATTIAECLHSFCRSCIIKYLEKNSFCPICEVQIHKTKPYMSLRLDKALQDVVYKLVPGLYHDEMKRRRKFYSEHQEQISITTPEQCGLEERIIFSPEDSISLSLEYLESDDCESEAVSSQSSESGDNLEGLPFPQQLGLIKLKNGDNRHSRKESQDVQEATYHPKRYLQCPAVVSVSHLKKFIRMKHDLTDKMQVDIIHKRVPLPDHYTLMDVAYIYTWKRSSPMRFFYQIFQTKKHKVKICHAGSETQEPKSEVVPEIPKVSNETSDNGLIKVGEVKPVVEVNKNSKIDFKNESEIKEKTITSEDKLLVKKNIKNVINMKSVGKLNADSNTKSESLEESVKEMNEEGKNMKTVIESEITVGHSENKKISGEKLKTNEEKNSLNTDKSEENESKARERLLLNPVSGQLESVPSTVTKEPSSIETIAVKQETESVGTEKNVTMIKCLKKTESESQKDDKKSNVNLLKSFRKDKSFSGKESKVELKSSNGSSLTITPVTKPEKKVEKETEKVSIEIKADNKSSEYDFDGSSPPSKIMPLQEFSKISRPSKFLSDHKEKWLSKEAKNNWIHLQDLRLQILKENDLNENPNKKCKRKSVPSLFRIGTEGNKKSNKKTTNGKLVSDKLDKPKEKKIAPTIINIHTESGGSSKNEIRIEASNQRLAPKPITIENKGGEYSIKQEDNENNKETNGLEGKSSPNLKKKEDETIKQDTIKEVKKNSLKIVSQGKAEDEKSKKDKSNAEETKNEYFGAIDLSKTDTSPNTEKNPLENLMDIAGKSGAAKTDEKMVEALISAAQKQSIEPLLRIPQYSQNLKSSPPQTSPPAGKNISPYDISQALQFFKDLRSDLKVLEAKSQLNPNAFLEQFSQKPPNLEPIQLYQQHIDLIRRLKRQQMAAADSETPQKKCPKLSPTTESIKKLSPVLEGKSKILEDSVKLKSSVDRTLSQIQEQMELQNRLAAAQSYKNFPALLQFYNRTSSFCPRPTSLKSKQPKTKSSSHSPNSQKSPTLVKSPQCMTSHSGNLSLPIPNNDSSSFFNAQNYSHLINAGLNSEMTFHQMFQNYLSQQEKLNQIKHTPPALSKKPGIPSTKSLSDLYYSPQLSTKNPEPGSVPAAQKT